MEEFKKAHAKMVAKRQEADTNSNEVENTAL